MSIYASIREIFSVRCASIEVIYSPTKIALRRFTVAENEGEFAAREETPTLLIHTSLHYVSPVNPRSRVNSAAAESLVDASPAGFYAPR